MLSVPKVGRPRNAWSPSRKRKLVRLYLFTRLTIDEIKDILAAIGFKPSRSDTQKKLHELLPHDYRADYRTFRPKDDSQMRNRFEILQFSMYKRSVSPREGEDQAQTKVVYEVEGANTAFPNFAKITGASVGGVQLSQLVKNPRIMLDGSSAIESLNSEPRTKSRRLTTRHRSSWNPSPASSSRGSEYKESEALSIGSIERRLGTSYSPAYLDHIGSVLQYSSPSSSGSSLSSSSPGSSSLSRISIQHSGLALSPSHLADCSRDRSWLESSSRLFKRAQEAWDEYIDESTLSPMVEFTCPAIRCSELNRYSSDNQAERLCNDCGVTRAHLLFSRDGGTRGEVPPIHSQVEQYLSQRDYYGNTPLHYAAASGNLEYLLDAGPRAMTKRNTAGQGVLHFIRCSKAEHVQTTMRIMSLMNNRFAQCGNGSSIFQARDCRGRTILHNLFESTSSEMYTPSVVEFLLDLTGVDIHTADNRGKSLLQMLNAKAEVHTDTLLKEFIRSRASLSVYSCGIPVVTSSDCAHNVLFDRYSLLLTSSRTSSDIIFELEKLALWRTNSLDIDWIDADGNTLLHALIRYWKDSNAENELTKIIKRLLTVRFYRRADFIEFRDRHGNTPLAAAAARGRRAVVKLLLNERANIHARNNGGDGIRKQVLKSKRSAKRGGQTELHARLESTLTLLGDSGAKDNPSRVDEWMTPQGKAELLKSLEGAATAPSSI